MRETLSKLTELKRQYAELSSKYTPQHPKLAPVQDQITALRASLQQQRFAMIDHAQQEYEDAVGREKQLADSYAAQARSLDQQAVNASQRSELARQVESNRQLYEQAVLRSQERWITSRAPRQYPSRRPGGRACEAI